MRRLAVVLACAVLLPASVVSGQTPYTIAYTLELGGDNHEQQYKNEMNVPFTPGTAPQPQTGFITWDVVAVASGSDGVNSIQGIANLVFNIELQNEDGTPVAPAKFFSTINDGNTDSPRAANAGMAEPFERAAFCLGWDVAMDYKWDDTPPNGNGDYYPDPGEDPALCYFDGAGPPFGPGRLYDPVTVGGPFMDRVQYPSTSYHGGGRMKGGAYFADCNGNLAEDDTEEDGGTDTNANGILDVCETMSQTVGGGPATEVLSAAKLSGMGAGYSQFSASANCLGVGLAVASVVPTWYTFDEYVGLGIKPVCEGQIDVSNLPGGTYKLVLTVPDNSNNVVPISYVPGAAGGFAVPAEQVIGSEVMFNWYSPPPMPLIWKSVRTHSIAGELPIDLVTDLGSGGSNPTVEPRNGGLQKITVQFDNNLLNAGYQAGRVIIGGTSGLAITSEWLASTLVSNDTLVLELSGSVDKACYTIDVSNVCSVPQLNPVCSILTLAGDSNNSRTVNTIDMAQVKSKIGQPVNASNCRQDLNLSGTINTIDMALAKSKIPNTAGTCP